MNQTELIILLIVAVAVLAAAFFSYVREVGLDRKSALSDEVLKDEKIEAQVHSMSDDQLDDFNTSHGFGDPNKPTGKPKR